MDAQNETDNVAFCPHRQCFVFDQIDTAQAFLTKFGALLLLEPFIHSTPKGEYLLAVEPILGVFQGD